MLDLAFSRASAGKGHERHDPLGRPFDQQPIMEIQRAVGAGFTLGQGLKKIVEASHMYERGECARAREELLDVIVYMAGAYLYWQEQQPERPWTPYEDSPF